MLRVSADLALASGGVSAVEQTITALGQVDALIHLAGGFAGGQRVEETSDEVWDEMLLLNLRTALNAMRAVIPPMRAAGKGRIIVVGSRAGREPAGKLSAYCASKAALHALVESAAAELKHAGVTVNALLPSTIDTPANRASMGKGDAHKWVHPDSLASLALWLCSDAGRDVTGALIPVYGRV